MPTERITQVSLLSIVIAVYNGAHTLEACLNSCLQQDYSLKQIIVIDGGSLDGTLDILRRYSSRLAYWVTEPDEGIYHAWNKALNVASGEWICFMGADDIWASSLSISQLMRLADYPAVNFVCAKVRRTPQAGERGKAFGEPWSFSRMKRGMTVAHTGMLHHGSLFEKFGVFDESYRIAGDYEFLLRAGSEIRAAYTEEEVVMMGGGGVSSTNLRTVVHEGRRALSERSEIGPGYGWMFFLRSWTSYLWRIARHPWG